MSGLAHRDDLQAKLVTGNARVGKEGHLPEIARKIRATDAHAVRADECFTGTGKRGLGQIDQVDLFRASELDGLHGIRNKRDEIRR